MGPGVVAIDDMELSALLERRGNLQAAAKEFKTLDEDVKELIQKAGVGDYVCGKFFCQTKEHDRKGYTVADSTYMQTKIVKLT